MSVEEEANRTATFVEPKRRIPTSSYTFKVGLQASLNLVLSENLITCQRHSPKSWKKRCQWLSGHSADTALLASSTMPSGLRGKTYVPRFLKTSSSLCEAVTSLGVISTVQIHASREGGSLEPSMARQYSTHLPKIMLEKIQNNTNKIVYAVTIPN